jgi:hypothetical protein
LTASPKIALDINTANSAPKSSDPIPANAPAANRSESPGKNGVNTSPVSQNTMAQSKA